jgi:hypothetical protein
MTREAAAQLKQTSVRVTTARGPSAVLKVLEESLRAVLFVNSAGHLKQGEWQITWNLQISGDFNKPQNRVREQVLGPKVLRLSPLVSATVFKGVLKFGDLW